MVDMETILLIVMFGFVVASNILTIIEYRSLGKITGHGFDNYLMVLIFFPIYLIFIIVLLSDSKNYVNHIQTFSILMLLFEPVGIYFGVKNRLRARYQTFLLILLFFLLLNYLNNSMLISSKVYVILLYFFHILARVFLWSWRWRMKSTDRYSRLL